MRLYVIDCDPGGWGVLTEALVACEDIPGAPEGHIQPGLQAQQHQVRGRS